MQLSGIARNPPGQAVKRKAGAQSVTSSSTLVDETDLQLAINPNETWVYTWELAATFSAAGQIKVAVTAPSGATVLAAASMEPNGIVPAFGTGAAGAGISLVAALSTAGFVRVTATVVNGANAGTVKLQFAQSTADGTATTIAANSSLTARRV